MYYINMMFNKKINILVTGAKGQLGSYLVEYFRNKSFYKNSKIGKVIGIDVDDLDIRCYDRVFRFFDKKSCDPLIDINYVIHCAAATNTTAIENDPFSYYATNCLGTRNLAECCAYNGIKMIFISTDYVLSELSPVANRDVQEFPVNQYGLQKLIAEQFVKDAFRNRQMDYMILRSSWMYGNSSNSFVEKFLANVFGEYAKNSRNTNDDSQINVKVVDDAYGRPTSVWFIADSIEKNILNKRYGTFNVQYDAPQISRYYWALMIWDVFLSYDNDANISQEDLNFIAKLKTGVHIESVGSNSLNMKMHHPGEIKSSSIDNAYQMKCDVYVDDTRKYVIKKWKKYIKMAHDIIGD